MTEVSVQDWAGVFRHKTRFVNHNLNFKALQAQISLDLSLSIHWYGSLNPAREIQNQHAHNSICWWDRHLPHICGKVQHTFNVISLL